MEYNNERQLDFLVGQYGDVDNAYFMAQNVATAFLSHTNHNLKFIYYYKEALYM